jgi:Glycosyl hydrolase family 81 C-terminal domain
MQQNRTMTFVYVIILIIFAGLITMGIQKKPISQDLESTAPSRDVPDLRPQDVTNGKFRVVTDRPGDYFLSEQYHNKYFPSSKIWSSVPSTGKLEGSYFFPYGIKELNGDLIVDIPRQKILNNSVLSDISADGLRIKTKDKITGVYLKDFSDLNVTFEFKSGDKVIYEGVFAQGLPYIYLYPQKGVDFTVQQERFDIENSSSNELVFMNEENRILVGNAKSWNQNGRDVSLKLQENKPLVLGYYPSNSQGANKQAILDGMTQEVASIWAEYSIADGKAQTKYTLNDNQNNRISSKVPFGLLPHHLGTSLQTPPLFSKNMIRGEQVFYSVDELTITLPLEAMQDELLHDIPVSDHELILTQLRQDIEELEVKIDTSYFGNKQLARAARLIQLARILKDDNLEEQATIKLKTAMISWMEGDDNTGKYFEWDKESGGIIARPSDFDSDKYNDHHFHYGYFLYAASVLAEEDKEFLNNYQSFINVVAYDISNVDRNYKDFPYIRTFDFYEGHSWASGYQNFGSGNNQESTSESVKAWYAVWKWGKVSNNEQFKEVGQYLYTMEINSARYYWLNSIKGRNAFPEGYPENKAGIVWGAKIDYATFFNQDPRAVEGIQYIPVYPGATYLYNPDVINRDLAAYRQKGLSLTSGPLIDYNVAYFAMTQGWDVLTKEELATLPIDDGNTRSNLYHWISYWNSRK